MSDVNIKHGFPPFLSTTDEWEYLYITQREWRDRVAAKCGYKWKFCLTPSSWRKLSEDSRLAVQDILNGLGAQGWELVACVPISVTFLGIGGSIGADTVFKRRVQAEGQKDD
jgi:hypothetical protein